MVQQNTGTAPNGTAKADPCLSWCKTGSCKDGSSCSKWHPEKCSYFASTGKCKFQNKCYKLHIRDPSKGGGGKGKAHVNVGASTSGKTRRERLMKERDDLNQILDVMARAESDDSIGQGSVAEDTSRRGKPQASLAKMTPMKPPGTDKALPSRKERSQRAAPSLQGILKDVVPGSVGGSDKCCSTRTTLSESAAKSSKSVSFTTFADTRRFNKRKLASVIALRNHKPTIFKRHNVRRDGEGSRRRTPRYSMSASRNPEVQYQHARQAMTRAYDFHKSLNATSPEKWDDFFCIGRRTVHSTEAAVRKGRISVKSLC